MGQFGVRVHLLLLTGAINLKSSASDSMQPHRWVHGVMGYARFGRGRRLKNQADFGSGYAKSPQHGDFLRVRLYHSCRTVMVPVKGLEPPRFPSRF